MTTIPLSLDGTTDLPAGKVANVVTFMERTEPSASRKALPRDLALIRVAKPSPSWYRALYRRIGENWLWFSRAVMPEDELATLISSPSTVILVLERNGEAIGLVELDATVAGVAEIVTFGVVPEETGTGAAKVMMEGALAQAFGDGARRIWLHTCTFDHPAAFHFYLRQGFRAFKFAIEVSDDPRLTGLLPEDAAPHVALIRPPRR